MTGEQITQQLPPPTEQQLRGGEQQQIAQLSQLSEEQLAQLSGMETLIIIFLKFPSIKV